MAPDNFSSFDPDPDNPFRSPKASMSEAPPPPPPPWSEGQPRQMCSEAIVAFVLSLIGIAGLVVCCFFIFAEIPALVIALIARKKIDANPNLDGRGLATAAMIISLGVLCFSVLILAGYGIFVAMMLLSGNT